MELSGSEDYVTVWNHTAATMKKNICSVSHSNKILFSFLQDYITLLQQTESYLTKSNIVSDL